MLSLRACRPYNPVPLILMALLWSPVTKAQKMLWSTPQKITNKTYYTEILGQNHSGIYYYQTSKNERERRISITALKHNMKSRAKQEFLNNSKESLVSIALLENWLAIFYTVEDRREDKLTLYAKMLDPALQQIGSDKLIDIYYTENTRDKPYEVTVSRDKGQMVVSIAQNANKRYDNLKFILLNKKCERIGGAEMQVGLQERQKIKARYFIDNSFLLMLEEEKRESIFRKKTLKRVIRKRIDSLDSSEEASILSLYSDEYNIRTGEFLFDNNDRALLYNSFYYSDDSLRPDGFIQYQFYTLGDSFKVKKFPFNPAFLNDVFGRSRSPKDLRTLYFMKSLKRSDGGDVFISERKEIDEQQMEDISIYGVQQSYTRYYYYYYEISVLSVNPDGSLDWHKMIKKEQISLNDEGYYSSFGCQVLEDELFFVYNDLSRKSSNVMLHTVDPNGTGKGDILVRGKELDGYAIPKESVQVSANELLVPVVKVREGFTILKLIF